MTTLRDLKLVAARAPCRGSGDDSDPSRRLASTQSDLDPRAPFHTTRGTPGNPAHATIPLPSNAGNPTGPGRLTSPADRTAQGRRNGRTTARRGLASRAAPPHIHHSVGTLAWGSSTGSSVPIGQTVNTEFFRRDNCCGAKGGSASRDSQRRSGLCSAEFSPSSDALPHLPVVVGQRSFKTLVPVISRRYQQAPQGRLQHQLVPRESAQLLTIDSDIPVQSSTVFMTHEARGACTLTGGRRFSSATARCAANRAAAAADVGGIWNGSLSA